MDLEELLRALAAGAGDLAPVDHVLLEGGSELAASAFEADLVDRVEAFMAPRVLGGRDAKTPLGGLGPESVDLARPVDVFRTRRLGSDLLVEGLVRRKDR